MTEHDEQAALIEWAKFAEPHYPDLALLFAIPNGGARHPATGARMKAEGVKPGVPDLFLPAPRRRYHGLFIEMKKKGGRVSADQNAWLDNLNSRGYATAVCYGFEDARKILEMYLTHGLTTPAAV